MDTYDRMTCSTADNMFCSDSLASRHMQTSAGDSIRNMKILDLSVKIQNFHDRNIMMDIFLKKNRPKIILGRPSVA